MKKILSPRYLATSLCFISLLLMSYAPKQNSESKFENNLVAEKLKKLVDNVFEDSVFKLIYTKDIDNILSLTHNTSSTDLDKLNELSKKTKFSEEETNYILSTVFGFKDVNDYNNYIDLYKYLIEKYDINKFNKNDQAYFFNVLRNKEIEYTGKLDELSKDPSKVDSLNRAYTGIRPECWKCVYDYQACLNPIIGVSYTTQKQLSGGTVQLYIENNTWHVVSIAEYNYTLNKVTYTTSSLTSSQCTTMYKSCIAQCNQP